MRQYPVVFLSKKGNGGYGDRLIGLISAYTFARMLRKPFIHAWPTEIADAFYDAIDLKDVPCENMIYFYWIQKPYHEMDILDTLTLETWENNTVHIETNTPFLRRLFDMNPLFQDYDFEEEFRRSARDIYQNICIPAFHIMPIPSCDVGIQIRCGDSYCNNDGDYKTGPGIADYIIPLQLPLLLVKLAKYIKKVIPKNATIFVTSDYGNVNVILAELLGDSYQVKWVMTPQKSHFDRASGIANPYPIIMEHVLLSRCNHIITNVNLSNFGTSAKLISQHTGRLHNFDYGTPRTTEQKRSVNFNTDTLDIQQIDFEDTIIFKEYRPKRQKIISSHHI